MNNRAFAIGAVVLVLIVVLAGSIFIIARGRSGQTTTKTTGSTSAVNLTIWRTFDDAAAFDNLAKAYQQSHPSVTFNYVKKDLADYEVQSLSALAAGTGPDIWSIPNDWVMRQKDKLVPFPDSITANKVTLNSTQIEQQYKSFMAPAASADNIIDHRIYGVPLYIDNLALYINSKLWTDAQAAYRKANANNPNFDDALFRRYPATWNDLLDVLPYLTKKDSNGTVTQAAIAMGTSNNVPFAADILSLLMMQNGATLVDQTQKAARFNNFQNDASGNPIYNGTNALDFYTSFARPDKSNYAWNASLPDALKALVDNKLAIMIGYQYLVQTIEQQYPTFQGVIAPMPQVKGGKTTNYASYWTETVTNNSKHADVAWDFLSFIANNPQNYLSVTKRPSALATTKPFDLNDVFGSQVMTARTWAKGKSPDKIDQIFNEMIDNVTIKGEPVQQSIDNAATKVTETLQKE